MENNHVTDSKKSVESSSVSFESLNNQLYSLQRYQQNDYTLYHKLIKQLLKIDKKRFIKSLDFEYLSQDLLNISKLEPFDIKTFALVGRLMNKIDYYNFKKFVTFKIKQPIHQLMLLGIETFQYLPKTKTTTTTTTPDILEKYDNEKHIIPPLMSQFITTSDPEIKKRIMLLSTRLQRYSESIQSFALATCDKEIFYCFHSVSVKTGYFSHFWKALTILSQFNSDEAKTRWMKIYHKLIKSEKNHKDDCDIEKQYLTNQSFVHIGTKMMENFCSFGFAEGISLLYQRGTPLSTNFSNSEYVSWLMRTEKHDQLLSKSDLFLQSSLYSNFNLFSWLIDQINKSSESQELKELHFHQKNFLDRWHSALAANCDESLLLLFKIDPLTQSTINSHNYWEIDSLNFIKFLETQSIHIPTEKLITKNCDIIVYYKNNLDQDLKQLQSGTFYIIHAIQQKRKDILDWHTPDLIFKEFVEYYKFGLVCKEFLEFASTENMFFLFGYLSANNFIIRESKLMYEIFSLTKNGDLLNYFFGLFNADYQTRIIIAINSLDSKIVQRFYEKGQSSPLDITLNFAPKKDIVKFINKQLIPLYNDFSCVGYKIGFNSQHRKDMIMGVNKNNKFIC